MKRCCVFFPKGEVRRRLLLRKRPQRLSQCWRLQAPASVGFLLPRPWHLAANVCHFLETNKAKGHIGQIRSHFFRVCWMGVGLNWFVIIWLVCRWQKNMHFPWDFLPGAFFFFFLTAHLIFFSCTRKVNHVRKQQTAEKKKVFKSSQRREELLNMEVDVNNGAFEERELSSSGITQNPEPSLLFQLQHSLYIHGGVRDQRHPQICRIGNYGESDPKFLCQLHHLDAI